MPARRSSQPQNALQSYGVLFPFGQYTLLNSLLTSVACYIALGLVIIVAVFPETVNHAALVSTSGFGFLIALLPARGERP